MGNHKKRMIDCFLPMQYAQLWSSYQKHWIYVSDQLSSRRKVYVYAATVTTGLVSAGSRTPVLLILPTVVVVVVAILSYFRTHTHIAMRPPILVLYEEALNDLVKSEALCAMHMLGAVSLGTLVRDKEYSGTIRERMLLWYSIPMYLTVSLLGVSVAVVSWQSISSIILIPLDTFFEALLALLLVAVFVLYSYFIDVGSFRPTDSEIKRIVSHHPSQDTQRFALSLMSIEYSRVRDEIDNMITDQMRIELLGIAAASALATLGFLNRFLEPIFLSIPLLCCVAAFTLYTETEIRIWEKYALWAEGRLRNRFGKGFGPYLVFQEKAHQRANFDLRGGIMKSTMFMLFGEAIILSLLCLSVSGLVVYGSFPLLLFLAVCIVIPGVMIVQLRDISRTELPPYRRIYPRSSL
jgi:hypothetical protein